MTISNNTRIFEITAAFLTALGKFLFVDFLGWRFTFTTVAILFWVSYVFIRYRQNHEILAYWGFSKNNFREVVIKLLPFAAISLIACFAIGYIRQTINISWHIIPILILYPLWGVIQQFLLVGLIAGNLKDFEGQPLKDIYIIFVSSICFAAIHYPYYWLIVGTFVLALIYSSIYLKKRNLYALGLFHGLLGALFFYTVVNRDPFLEMFGNLLNLK
ncbi:MAG: CPBP family intramembrane metalloprotease [Flavobacteriales bacterium]|nr:CPBP family intramembrane metalloprotease [Flavobacteriales bacterium]